VVNGYLHSSWFLTAIGIAVGGVAAAGLTLDAVPSWLRWASEAVVAIVVVAPALPFVALLPWYFVALRRGLISRSRGPCTVAVAHGVLRVDRGATQTRYRLAEVSRARSARNDNWSESAMLEDALGLFSAKGREIVRVPLAATGIHELVRALDELGVQIDDVLVTAPTFLD
jgi:hypothetical protein